MKMYTADLSKKLLLPHLCVRLRTRQQRKPKINAKTITTIVNNTARVIVAALYVLCSSKMKYSCSKVN